jgi:hypothetical protein
MRVRVLEATIVSRLETLPRLLDFSDSGCPSDRAVFVRVFGDYARYLVSRALPIPDDWRIALEACLAKADPKECGQYLFHLAEFDLKRHAAYSARPLSPRVGESQKIIAQSQPSGTQAAIDRAEVEALLQEGDLNALVALACDRSLHLNARQVAALADRARQAVDFDNDRRLADAVLAVNPTRIEMAPLFLEANADKRWAIALAAQRAELGRRRNAAFATVARESVTRLEFAAIAGNESEFEDLLGRAIGAPPGLRA